MSLIDYIFFIDDDYPTNYFHELVANESEVVKEVRCFLSPKKALQYFIDVKDGKELRMPNLIFLDINMPEINGYEFLEMLKSQELPHVPTVVMLSTSLNPKDREVFEANEMVIDFINKPLTKEYLKSILKKLK